MTGLLLLSWRLHLVRVFFAVRALGPWGGVTYALVYAAATVFLVPGTILSLGAGSIYGPLYGVFIVMPGSLIGASLAFWLARRLGRERLEHRLLRREKLRVLDHAIASDGFRVILLMRLDPVFLPFAPLNYALGLTGVRFRDYFFASWVGMLPATILYVYFGSLLRLGALSKATPGPGASWRPWLFVPGAAVLIALFWIVRRGARKALREQGLNISERPA